MPLTPRWPGQDRRSSTVFPANGTKADSLNAPPPFSTIQDSRINRQKKHQLQGIFLEKTKSVHSDTIDILSKDPVLSKSTALLGKPINCYLPDYEAIIDHNNLYSILIDQNTH